MDTEIYEITRDWLLKNKTKRGGWTKRQIEALGENYPPTRGWMSRVCDTFITAEDAAKFEKASGQYADTTVSKLGKLKANISTLDRGDLELLRDFISHKLK